MKDNHPGLVSEVKANFTTQDTYEQINKGHGQIEKRVVSICQNLDMIRDWPGLKTLLKWNLNAKFSGIKRLK